MNVVFGNEVAFLATSKFENEELLDNSIKEIESLLLSRPTIIVYGRVCHQNRDVGFFSDTSIGYEYSNKLMKSQPMTPSLLELLDNINKLFGSNFNGILINRYNDGSDCIGAHSDDESSLDTSIGVVAISYGIERIFRIRTKPNKKIVHDEITTHCGIIQMGGEFQTLYTHEIPAQKKIDGIRYSFTFRSHLK